LSFNIHCVELILAVISMLHICTVDILCSGLESVLTVERVRREELGHYNCTIHNRFGVAAALITLQQPQGN
jgi:hypothetical protein